jgi:hypothetical protein
MTNNKQETAVELFIEQLEEKGNAYEENQVVRTINICIDVSDYMELKQQANERHKQQIINAVDDLLDYINSLQNNYIALSKNDKKKSKEVDAILTATTLIKMRIQSLNK